MSQTRELYNRCYRAFRAEKTSEIIDISRNNYEIFRAVVKCRVENVGHFDGWIKKDRWFVFLCRQMDLQHKVVSP